MPYTNNNFQNGIGLGYQNPIKKAFLNKNENSIIEAFNKQYQNYKRSVHSQPQVSPPKATTFMDGVKANLQRFGNDLEYLSAEIQKKSAGEEFFTDVISKLQNFYNGNLAKQPIHELRQRMRKIEDDNYEVPLREYYLPKDIQPDNLPAENRLPLSEQYKLKLPDNPLFDMEGLSLNEWLEREAKIKDILKENYIPTPPKRDIFGYNTSLHDDLSQKDIWQEGELGNEYSNSLKRSLVKEEGDKLNIRTRMFNNLGELPEGYKKYLDDHSYSKGFYNPETEEVVIIGNNIASHSDLQNILIQKAYESKGLEDVLGNELDNLLEEVYNNMSNRDSKVYSQNGDTSRKVALSYISDLAKNPRINPEE